MTSLKEKAIAAWNERFNKYSESAMKELANKLNIELVHICIISIESGKMLLGLDGLIIQVKRDVEYGYYTFHLVNKCQKCGREFTDGFYDLESLGCALTKEHDCDMNQPKKIIEVFGDVEED